jgi:serine protease Do
MSCALLRIFSVLAALPFLAAMPAFGQAPSATDIVPCYDAERELVSHGLAAACQGEVIDAARENELASERRRRIQAAVAGRLADPITGNRRLSGTGSGFYISAAGDALTNNHVIAGCELVTVTTEGSAKVPATVAATDPQHDIALLHAAAPAPAFARFSAVLADPTAHDLAVVGYPAYGLPTIRSSLAPASEMRQFTADGGNIVVFDGVIRRGHSGSPLLDDAGNVLGIVRAKYDSVKYHERTGRLPPDVGFAIPQAEALRFAEAHGVHPTTQAATAPLSREALLDKARAFVVQVGCWR